MTSTSTADGRRLTLVDVFTDVALTGNGLAVVADADGLPDAVMFAFAHETRLAETTFVQTATEPGADYRNRIWSMIGEMPFAGHPSLGTAVAVARWAGVTGEVRYVQQTGVGLQPIDVRIDGEVASASMLQNPPAFGPEHDPGPLLEAVGLTVADAHPELPPQTVSTGINHIMVPVREEATLARCRSDTARVDALLGAAKAYGLYVAAPTVADGRARVRMFGQSAQIVEDPATGSAAGPLCAYLHARLGMRSVTITQGAEMGRRSILRTEIDGDGVRVSGDCVPVIDGTVRLPSTA